MAKYVDRSNAVEAVQFQGREHESWPAFCAWCVDHEVDVSLYSVIEDDAEGSPIVAPTMGVEVEGYKKVDLGSFVVLISGRYSSNRVEVIEASEFSEKYAVVEF